SSDVCSSDLIFPPFSFCPGSSPIEAPLCSLKKTFVLFVVKTPALKKFYRKFTPQQIYDFTTQQFYNSAALRLPNHLQDFAVLKPTSHEIFYCFGFTLVFLAALLFKI